MNKLHNIDDIKSEHDRLYSFATTEVPSFLSEARKNYLSETVVPDSTNLLAQDKKYSNLLDQINQLLSAMKVFFQSSTSLEDNLWLINATVLWKGVFTSILNIPRKISLGEPPKHLLPSLPSTSGSGLTELELDGLVRQQAEYFEVARIAKLCIPHSEEEQKISLRLANTYLASEILDGKINFAKRLSSLSYYRLEKYWLKDIKDFRAYFVWQNRGGEFNDKDREKDYLLACDHIRDMLVNDQIKALPIEFGEAKQYLERQYLNGSKVDEGKAREIIKIKANRLAELQGNKEDHSFIDWVDAVTYVKMFYENIIPAVLDGDADAVLAILKAFQFTRIDQMQHITKHHIVNCFEVAIATYFISPIHILEHWKHAEEHGTPLSAFDAAVPFTGNSQYFNIPSDLRDKMWFSEGRINFKGIMKQSEKQVLDTSNPEYAILINELFNASRLIHKETTL